MSALCSGGRFIYVHPEKRFVGGPRWPGSAIAGCVLRALTAEVASHDLVHAAVRAVGYTSEEEGEESEEEEGSSVEEEREEEYVEAREREEAGLPEYTHGPPAQGVEYGAHGYPVGVFLECVLRGVLF